MDGCIDYAPTVLCRLFANKADLIEACRVDGLFTGWDSLDVFQILWSRIHGLISLRLKN